MVNSALILVESFKPDLIFLDLILPDIHGFEIAKYIRKNKANDNIKIIAISASVFESTQKESINAGCNEFMNKPFKEQQLLYKIQEVLDINWIYKDEDDEKDNKNKTLI